MITLSDGTTTITLPDGLQWQDEFGWEPVESSTEYSLSGALIVQEAAKQDGRPFTLYGGNEGAWATRATIKALHQMASVPGKTLTLSLWGQQYTVIFRRPALAAAEIMRLANPGDDHFYSITINLTEVNP